MPCAARTRWQKCTGNAHAGHYARLLGINSSSPKRPPPSWHRLASWHPHVHADASHYAGFVTRIAPLVLPTFECGCGLTPDAAFADAVAVHVRCSDVPWVKNKDYHVPDPAYWPFVAKWLRAVRAPRRVLIFNASSHRTGDRPAVPSAEERAMCARWAGAIGTFFHGHGFAVSQFEGRGEREAMRALLGAHTIVAAMASSFSFFAGLAKRPLRERFVTPLLYREEEERAAEDAHVGRRPAPCGVPRPCQSHEQSPDPSLRSAPRVPARSALLRVPQVRTPTRSSSGGLAGGESRARAGGRPPHATLRV